KKRSATRVPIRRHSSRSHVAAVPRSTKSSTRQSRRAVSTPSTRWTTGSCTAGASTTSTATTGRSSGWVRAPGGPHEHAQNRVFDQDRCKQGKNLADIPPRNHCECDQQSSLARRPEYGAVGAKPGWHGYAAIHRSFATQLEGTRGAA